MTIASDVGGGLSVDPAILPIRLITGEQLAAATGFPSVNARFRSWCREIGIATVPGRRNIYDPELVHERLDISQGLSSPTPQDSVEKPLSLIEQRRMRRHAR